MRPITPKIQNLLSKEQLEHGGCMRRSILNDHICKGRLGTREHAWIYGGSQIDEWWAILLLCAYSHSVDQYQDGGILNKEINEWLSLWKVKEGDLDKYPRKDWKQRKFYLEKKYGKIG